MFQRRDAEAQSAQRDGRVERVEGERIFNAEAQGRRVRRGF